MTFARHGFRYNTILWGGKKEKKPEHRIPPRTQCSGVLSDALIMRAQTFFVNPPDIARRHFSLILFTEKRGIPSCLERDAPGDRAFGRV